MKNTMFVSLNTCRVSYDNTAKIGNKEEMLKDIDSALSTLSPEEVEIIRLKLGFDTIPLEFGEIEDILEINDAEAKYAEALLKLKNPTLKEWWEEEC